MKLTKRECVKCGYMWMTKRIDELCPECEQNVFDPKMEATQFVDSHFRESICHSDHRQIIENLLRKAMQHSEDIQQHCGHPVSKIVTGDEGTCYCSFCEEESRFEQWLDAEAKEFFNAGGFGLVSKFKDVARKAFKGSWKKKQ